MYFIFLCDFLFVYIQPYAFGDESFFVVHFDIRFLTPFSMYVLCIRAVFRVDGGLISCVFFLHSLGVRCVFLLP